MFGVGLHLWNRSDFEDFGVASYVPVHFIYSKFATAYGSIVIDSGPSTPSHESVLFVCPLRSAHFL